VILVTGATGFLGRCLCPHLVQQGYTVRALVRPSSDVQFLKSLGIELAQGDIREPQATALAAAGCQAVIHAAGKFRLWGKREEFFSVNLTGTRNILEAACSAGVERFVHLSTLAAIGRPPPGRLVTEQTVCRPHGAYQESKMAAEQEVLRAHRERGLAAIVLRPGAFYGPGSRYAFNRLFFEDPLKGLALRVHRGHHVIFPVHVADVARAAELALERGRAGEVYNICGPCLSHREIGRVVEQYAGRPIRWIDVPAWGMVALARAWGWLSRYTQREPYYPLGLYPYVFYDWRVGTEKAERELGFQPTPFEQGARETIAWYRRVLFGA